MPLEGRPHVTRTYRVVLPDGQIVEADISAEMLEIARRVRAAFDDGREPDLDDVARLMEWSLEEER